MGFNRRSIFAGAPLSMLAAAQVSKALTFDEAHGEIGTRGAQISVTDFGAIGDGVADDGFAILLARTAAVSQGLALFFPEGRYAHAATLEFGFDSLHIYFEGNVSLVHTGVGKAISFDSGRIPQEDGKTDIHFGWGNPPTLVGSTNTTDLVYVRGCHHMKLELRLRDCSTGFRCEFSVLSHFRINMSGNQGGWKIQNPRRGIIVDRRGDAEATTSCRFDVIIEGIQGLGIELIYAQHCEFWGTSEANAGGGINIGSASTNNNFYNFFCEQNGDAPHWLIDGHNNILFNCTGGGPANQGYNGSKINGVRNLLVRGRFNSLDVGGYYNELQQTGILSQSSVAAGNILEKCHDGAGGEILDQHPLPIIQEPVLLGTWAAQLGQGQRAPGFHKDQSGVVRLLGAVRDGTDTIFKLPVGYRPRGVIRLRYDQLDSGKTGQLAVFPDGQVRHLSGKVDTVTLDNLSFLAEN